MSEDQRKQILVNIILYIIIVQFAGVIEDADAAARLTSCDAADRVGKRLPTHNSL